MTTRDNIVTALAALGLTASATKTGPISAKDAWPVWRSTRWANYCTPFATFDVFVALADGGADVTITEADPLVADVAEALTGIGLEVLLAEPVRTNVTEQSPGVPALRFSAREG